MARLSAFCCQNKVVRFVRFSRLYLGLAEAGQNGRSVALVLFALGAVKRLAAYGLSDLSDYTCIQQRQDTRGR